MKAANRDACGIYINKKKEPLDAVPFVRFKMGLNQRPPD